MKKKIRDMLSKYEGLWVFMPVPTGYGRRTVDFIGCYRGRFFAIEAKKPGGNTTALQDAEIASIRAAGGAAFVIDNDAGLFQLKAWLDRC